MYERERVRERRIDSTRLDSYFISGPTTGYMAGTYCTHTWVWVSCIPITELNGEGLHA